MISEHLCYFSFFDISYWFSFLHFFAFNVAHRLYFIVRKQFWNYLHLLLTEMYGGQNTDFRQRLSVQLKCAWAQEMAVCLCVSCIKLHNSQTPF